MESHTGQFLHIYSGTRSVSLYASGLNQHDMNSYFIIYKYFIHIFIFLKVITNILIKKNVILYSKVLLYEDILIGEVNLSTTPMRTKSSKKILQNLL